MIQSLQADAPIQQLCQVFDCPRSTYYYQSMKHDEADLVAAIETVLMRRPWFGYRRVVAQLRREGVTVGETVARRILRQLAYTRSVGQVRVQTTDSNHPYTRYTNLIRGMKPKLPNQIWVADITYIRLGTRFLYLAVILDAFSRAVRGWALSRSLSQDLSLDALKMVELAAHNGLAICTVIPGLSPVPAQLLSPLCRCGPTAAVLLAEILLYRSAVSFS